MSQLDDLLAEKARRQSGGQSRLQQLLAEKNRRDIQAQSTINEGVGQNQPKSGGVSNTLQQTIPSNQATPTINNSGGFDFSISRNPETITTSPLISNNLHNHNHSEIKRIVTDRVRTKLAALRQQNTKPQRGIMDNIEGGVNSAFDTLLMGASDDIQGHINAVTGKAKQLFNGEDYSYEQLRQAGQDYANKSTQDFAEANPYTNAGLQGATMALTAAKTIPETIANSASKPLAKFASSALTGAGYGALSGAGHSDADNIADTLKDTAKGAGVGFVGGLASQGIANPVGKAFVKKPKIQTTSQNSTQIKKQASKAYDSAEGLGVVIKPEAFKRMNDEFIESAKKLSFDKDLHKKIKVPLKRFLEKAEADGGVNLEELGVIRRLTQDAGASFNNTSQQRVSKGLVKTIDSMMENLKKKDVMSGDAKLASGAYKSARGLWSTAKKAETIEKILKKAKRDSSGEENGIRLRFKNLLNNDKKIAQFNKEEIELMEKIVKGDLKGNTLRQLGKFGFGGSSNALGGSIGVFGGAIGALAVPLAGSVTKHSALKATQKRVNDLVKSADNVKRKVATPDARRASAGAAILQDNEVFNRPSREVHRVLNGQTSPNNVVKNIVDSWKVEDIQDLKRRTARTKPQKFRDIQNSLMDHLAKKSKAGSESLSVELDRIGDQKLIAILGKKSTTELRETAKEAVNE